MIYIKAFHTTKNKNDTFSKWLLSWRAYNYQQSEVKNELSVFVMNK